MKLGGCTREKEVAELLANGHWPDACGDELRSHVTTCRACQDLILLKQAFRADRQVAVGSARLESPGVLWWRAQLRRRNAAIVQISRPILGAQIFAVAVTLVAAVVYMALQARRGFGWLDWLAQVPRALHLEVLLPDALQKYPGETWLVFSAIAMLALMSAVIVYKASEKR
jgi:hypothetical protein